MAFLQALNAKRPFNFTIIQVLMYNMFQCVRFVMQEIPLRSMVNYPRLKTWAFHRLIIMLHSKNITNSTWTNEVVYGTSPLGNLGRNMVSDIFPLQEGFDGDSQRCLSVGIDYLSAFAFEQGIIGAMSLTHRTAMSAPFACVPSIHDVQMNITVKTSLLKDLSELEERNTHNGSVESSAFSSEPVELFNSDFSVKSFCDSDNFPDNLSEICFDKISFIGFNHFKLSNRVNGLEQSLSFHNLLSFSPDMLSEISLIKCFAFGGNNTDGKMFRVNVNAKNIFSLFNNLFFGKIGDNLQIFCQSESLASPSVINQALKSLIVPILFDWNGNPYLRINSKPDEEIDFCAESLAVSRNIELDSQSVGFLSFLFPSIANKAASDLNIERGVYLAN